MGDRNYDGTVTRAAPFGRTPANFKLDDNYNHTILIGFRYAFGAPPPAPVAPAPAAVAPSPVSRSYLVFFDWDKATLTDAHARSCRKRPRTPPRCSTPGLR